MNIYVVFNGYWGEGGLVECVFSKLEDADQYIKDNPLQDLQIFCFLLDAKVKV